MATLYSADGTIQTHVPSNGPTWSLRELQFLVGGYIEQVRHISRMLGLDEDPEQPVQCGLTEGQLEAFRGIVYCDEDGRSKQLPFNAIASNVLGHQVFGPVLVLDAGEES